MGHQKVPITFDSHHRRWCDWTELLPLRLGKVSCLGGPKRNYGGHSSGNTKGGETENRNSKQGEMQWEKTRAGVLNLWVATGVAEDHQKYQIFTL